MRAGPPLDPLTNLALSRSAHVRSAELRADGAALERMWGASSTRVLHVNRGHVATDGAGLRWLTPSECAADAERYFLGIHDQIAYFACATGEQIEPAATLRELGAVLGDLEVGLIVQAVALSQWHATHSHCARCGAQTHSSTAGYSRTCIACSAEHYPRTDPAVIVLVHDADDRILLGRQAAWPEGRFSTFAGFVEPGESFEAAVVREVLEEAGVQVERPRYLGSQPWPFPASVMIAFSAVATDPQAARADGAEIEQIRWLTRAELSADLAAGRLILPPSVSVARRMIETWFGGRLAGGEAWR